jgi:hypothetical protein
MHVGEIKTKFTGTQSTPVSQKVLDLVYKLTEKIEELSGFSVHVHDFVRHKSENLEFTILLSEKESKFKVIGKFVIFDKELSEEYDAVPVQMSPVFDNLEKFYAACRMHETHTYKKQIDASELKLHFVCATCNVHMDYRVLFGAPWGFKTFEMHLTDVWSGTHEASNSLENVFNRLRQRVASASEDKKDDLVIQEHHLNTDGTTTIKMHE